MSARDEGGAYARIRENLSEPGLDAMAAGLPHWMSAVAAGEADFASAMLAMTSEEAEAKRRRVLPPMYFPPFTPMIHNRSRQPAPAGYANVFPPLSAPPSNLSRNARASRARALSEPG